MNIRRTDQHSTFANGHKPQRALTKVLFGAILAGFVVTAAVACGDTITNNTAKCGAGTKLVGDTCVSDVADTGGNATPDSGAVDTGSDAAAEAEAPIEPDDPCPVADADTVVFNCDPKCGALTGGDACRKASCRTVSDPLSTPSENTPNSLAPWYPTDERFVKRWILRLPHDPWVQLGECDPDRKAYVGDGFFDYPAQKPQPRYYITITPSFHQIEDVPGGPVRGTIRFAVLSPVLKTRFARQFRYKYPEGNLTRLDPLGVLGAPGGPESDHLGCRRYDAMELDPLVINLTDRNYNQGGVVVLTSRAHEPATNITFYFDQTACPVNP